MKILDLVDRENESGNWVWGSRQEHRQFFGGDGKDDIIVMEVYEGDTVGIAAEMRQILPKNYTVELWDLATIIAANP